MVLSLNTRRGLIVVSSKELIKEIIELLLRISSKLNLKSQLSSVQHQLVSVLTK